MPKTLNKIFVHYKDLCLNTSDEEIKVGPINLTLQEGQKVLILHNEIEILQSLIGVTLGWIKPHKGEVFVNDINVLELEGGLDPFILGKTISVVYRESTLLSQQTIVDNLLLSYLYNFKLDIEKLFAMAEAHINSLNLNDYAYTIPSEQLPEKKRRLGLYALALAKQPKLFLLERPQQFLDQDFPLVWSRIHDYVEKGYSPEIEDFIEQKLNDHHKKVKESASQKSKKNKTDEKLLKDNNAKETNNDKRQDKSENIDVKQDKDKGESTDRYKGKEEDKIRSALLIFGRMQERYDNYSFDQIIKLK